MAEDSAPQVIVVPQDAGGKVSDIPEAGVLTVTGFVGGEVKKVRGLTDEGLLKVIEVAKPRREDVRIDGEAQATKVVIFLRDRPLKVTIVTGERPMDVTIVSSDGPRDVDSIGMDPAGEAVYFWMERSAEAVDFSMEELAPFNLSLDLQARITDLLRE
jgi:hypothetical protein